MSFIEGDYGAYRNEFRDYMHDRKIHLNDCSNPECECKNCDCDPCECTVENPCGCEEKKLIELRGGQ